MLVLYERVLSVSFNNTFFLTCSRYDREKLQNNVNQLLANFNRTNLNVKNEKLKSKNYPMGIPESEQSSKFLFKYFSSTKLFKFIVYILGLVSNLVIKIYMKDTLK